MQELSLTTFVIDRDVSRATQVMPQDCSALLLTLMSKGILVPLVPLTEFKDEAVLLAFRRTHTADIGSALLVPGAVVMKSAGADIPHADTIRLLCELLWKLKNDEDTFAMSVLSEVARAFLALVHARQRSAVQGKSAPGRLSARQHETATEFMMAHVDTQFRIADVANVCGLSAGHFNRAFRATTGMTPMKWIVEKRMELARQLLSAERCNVADVAFACGYSEQSGFTRAFSRSVGAPPGVWSRGVASEAA